jgi:hypothetical protein
VYCSGYYYGEYTELLEQNAKEIGDAGHSMINYLTLCSGWVRLSGILEWMRGCLIELEIIGEVIGLKSEEFF